MSKHILLGDEALALGAIHAGITQAYGYPGTPSTEIMEYLLDYQKKNDKPLATWCSNEKTAYEEALGASFAGRRVLVTMKHVGLNVAADAFMNSALLSINGGLVLAVADDPGMHSSQGEQDSRFFADFAKIICLEPVNQQECYDMVREAFDISEKFQVPVMIRMVTRLSHSRSQIKDQTARVENPLKKSTKKKEWQLIPAWARTQWTKLMEDQAKFRKMSEESNFNSLTINEKFNDVGIITSGLGFNYYKENLEDLKEKLGATPSHLHIGFYPPPYEKIRELAGSVKKIIFLEEGYPFIEQQFRGILPQAIEIKGKIDGTISITGELNPDNVRKAIGLKAKDTLASPQLAPSPRPPQLCKGCPHEDTFDFIKEAIEDKQSIVTSDIGCYALGALPPYSASETIICMGASITAAKGAAEAGHPNVIGVIGDSTFYHSGLTGLVDCVSHKAPVVIIIVDNDTVGMTGGQETILASSRLEGVVTGLGVDPNHLKVVPAHRKSHEENVKILNKELAYNGVSVIIAVRECIVAGAKRRKAAAKGDA